MIDAINNKLDEVGKLFKEYFAKAKQQRTPHSDMFEVALRVKRMAHYVDEQCSEVMNNALKERERGNRDN